MNYLSSIVIKLNMLKTRMQNTPRSFYLLCYVETCELFGRFGITALLVLYLTHTLHDADAHAFALFGAFIALLYITPVIGGILADRYLGSRHAVIAGGLIASVGNLLLFFPQPKMVCLWPGDYCSR